MKLLLLAAALLGAVPAAAVNLVTNGDFSAGNTGFTSAYTFQTPGQYGNPGTALEAGLYAIDTDANNTHVAWVELPDHTGDSAGLYLIANGAGADIALWEQNVTVAPNTTYNFSAWVADVCCLVPGVAEQLAGVSPPSFTFRVIDGQTVTTIGSFTPDGVGAWENFSGTFTNGASTSLTLRIVNLNNEPAGNDLGLDDISFAAVAVPEPTTWALLGMGFAMVGAALRRRTRAIAA